MQDPPRHRPDDQEGDEPAAVLQLRRRRPAGRAEIAGQGELAAPAAGAMTLGEMERSAILQALARARDNQVKAAKLLGISRDTLRYRMKKHGLLDGLEG
jgi:transcriptional regulator with PAS, ATPase and Fis domain